MDRREFFLRTGIISAALGASVGPEIVAAGKDAPAKHASRNGSLDLTNEALTWHLEWRNGKLATTGFDNKLSGHPFKFPSAEEFALTFSSAQQRIEIPGWKFVYGRMNHQCYPNRRRGSAWDFKNLKLPMGIGAPRRICY